MEQQDVVVVGGGPAGVGAAVAAARAGASVALVEAHDVLGGSGTIALVNNFCNAYWDGDRFIIGGVFGELRHRLQGRKVMWTTRGPTADGRSGQEFYDPDAYADELEALCRDAGVSVHLDARCTGGSFDDGSARLDIDGGPTVGADVIVDATGDAVVAHNAGAPTTMADPDDLQPLTYCYMFGPVDLDALGAAHPDAIQYDPNVDTEYAYLSFASDVQQGIRDAIAAGDLDIPTPALYATASVPGHRRYLTTNFGHVEVDDPTDPDALDRATAEGRRQMREGVRWLRANVEGCSDIEMVEEPRQIGIRQSRQVEGEYVLTADDITHRRQFDDVIAQCCFNVDVHAADTEVDAQAGVEGGRLESGEHYDIPLRSLVPASGPSNLLVAGRCISATPEAMSSFRVSPSVMAIGEAAGVTAALAAEAGDPVGDVPADRVQHHLRHTGAVLD